MADTTLQSAIPIKDIGPQKDTFNFKIPTIHDEIRIGTRIHKLHKAIDPDWDGFEMGLDGNTLYALRACATLEILLQESSAKWVFSESPSGVIVDSSKFPPDRVNDAILAYQGFSEALSTFRETGIIPSEPAGQEAVAGEPDTQ